MLLIACANLASLLAARAVTRQREIAVRLAIGSSAMRLVQQLITESVFLAVAGGLAGIGLAVVMVKELVTFLPNTSTAYAVATSPDWRTLSFALGLSVVTGVLFGLIPAWQAAWPNLAETLKAKATNVSGGRGHFAVRRLLVGAQIALSLLLLTGATLLVRSLTNLYSVSPGFKTKNIVQFDIDLGSIGYDAERAHAFYRELETRLDHLPGVRSAGSGTNSLLTDSDWESVIRVEGPENKPHEDSHAYVNVVSPGYFQMLGIHLLSGRTFRSSDTSQSAKVIVVSESFAKHYFGRRSAIDIASGEVSMRATQPTWRLWAW